MSGVSDIGIRMSLVGGKEVAAQTVAVADSIKTVGTAAEETDAKLAAASVGIDTTTVSMGKLTDASLLSASAMRELQTAASMASIDATIAMGKADIVLEEVAVSEAKIARDSKVLNGSLNTLGISATSLGKNFLNLGKQATTGFAAAAAIIGFETTKMAMGYEKTTTQIAATANMSVDAAGKITQAFLHTSGSVTYNAQEMASAFQPISAQLTAVNKGALDVRTSMMFMNAAMDLATATGEQLSTDTQSLTNVMQAYGLGVGQAATVSNILYNTSRLTANTTDALATTMDHLHQRLGQVMPSLADTSGLMMDLATKGGVSGSRGINMVSGALTTLLSRSPDVSSMLNRFGLTINSFMGPDGKFIGMANAIGILQPKLASLNQSQQLLAETSLFGSGAAQAMGKTVLAGVAAYNQSYTAATRLNGVQQAAAKVTQSLDGQIAIFKKDLHNMGIDIGQFLLPKLVAMGKWMQNNKPIVIALAAVIGGVLVAAMIAWIATVTVATYDLLAFGIELLALEWPFVLLAAVLVFFGLHWRQVWSGIKNIFDTVWHAIDDTLRVFGFALMAPVTYLMVLWTHWREIWTGMKNTVNAVWNFLKPIFDKIAEGMHLVGNAMSWVSHAGSFVGKIFGFAEGGVVPGPQGAPMLAMVHGGEVITPPQNIYNATGTAMTAPMIGQAVSKVSPGSANSSAVPSQVISNDGGGAGQPTVIQLVVDRKVLAELVYTEMQNSYARR
jgi:TP901 family phage tail tape measure protein